MIRDITVPPLPESVADAVIANWLKKEGDFIKAGESLLELETDKVILDVPAPFSGILQEIFEHQGETVLAEQVIGKLKEQEVTSTNVDQQNVATENTRETLDPPISPSVRQQLAESNLSPQDIKGSGKKGRILKEDVQTYLQQRSVSSSNISTKTTGTPPPRSPATPPTMIEKRPEKRVPMTRLRQRIAERLLSAQQQAAILTTFNEVDLTAIKRMRSRYQERFVNRHQTKLGFMSFFVKASTEALKRFPEVNARIDEDEIVYNGFYDIGVAVSTERGLVVPIIKDADQMSYAEIELKIKDYAQRARSNRLDIDELKGGTFSISNGGVFGSMLSTPILNPPQSAILGMHSIQDRPVAIDGDVTIRPMMYLALSYDHRLIDGKTAVSFLVKIKELLEDPASLLLEL